MSGPGTAPWLLQTEAQFQRAILDAAAALGWMTYHTKFSVGSKSGYPDLTCWHAVHPPVWFEVKRENGVVSANQRAYIESIQAAHGCRAYVVRPSDWEMVESILRGER